MFYSEFLGQEYVRESLKSSPMNFYGRYGDLPKYYEFQISHILPSISDISLNCDRVIELGLITVIDVITKKMFHEHLQRVWLTNRGRLLLRTPGLSRLGLAFVVILRPFNPELVMTTDPFEFQTPLDTSILLISMDLAELRGK